MKVRRRRRREVVREKQSTEESLKFLPTTMSLERKGKISTNRARVNAGNKWNIFLQLITFF